MTDAPHDLTSADGRPVHQDRRWRRSRGVPLPTQRERLEAAVEAALAAVEAAVVEMDAMDGDPDLEEGGDREPDLAAIGSSNVGNTDDRELDPAEEEHTLGWTEGASLTGRLDLGADDCEASLASTGVLDQRRWSAHMGHAFRSTRDDDLEEQCEDEGASDDREPDRDGDGMVERSWQIGGREAHLIDGATLSWAERQER